MAEAFESLGIYGISRPNEILMLQSLVTGDPMLMIGKHGSAKTASANMVAIALDLRFKPYDASKSMFEDMIGMPNPRAMAEGRMEYIPGEITLWDKEFILIDEVNRASPETQSKWLEIIRSRKVMGLPLDVKFIWGAMNPMGYEGTQIMDDAYAGRFGTFVYIPSVVEMSNFDDRMAVVRSVGLDDAPALGYWTGQTKENTISTDRAKEAGKKIRELLVLAQEQYWVLAEDPALSHLDDFLAKFATALFEETRQRDGEKDIGQIELDGRRLGMMRRSIIASKALDIAHSQIYGTIPRDLKEVAQVAVQGSIPSGVNEEGGSNASAQAHIDNVFIQLGQFFEKNCDIRILNLTFELLTGTNIIRKAEILLSEDIEDLTKRSTWKNILEETSLDISVVALLALNLEVRNRGLVPANVLDQMTQKIDNELLRPKVPPLTGSQLNYYTRVADAVAKGGNIIERLLVCHNIKKLVEDTKSSGMSDAHMEQFDKKNKEDIARLNSIYDAAAMRIKQNAEVFA